MTGPALPLLGALCAGAAAWLAAVPQPGDRLTAIREPARAGRAGAVGRGRYRGPGAVDLAVVAERLAAAVDAGLPLETAWRHGIGSVLPAGCERVGRPWTEDAAVDDPVDAAAMLDELDALTAGAPAAELEAALGLGAALRLSAGLGVPPVEALRAVARGIREAEAARAARAAAVAGPTAAARIVALLPVAGPLLGTVLGIDTPAILLGTPWGRLCLVAGLAFLGLAARWSGVLVARARAEVVVVG